MRRQVETVKLVLGKEVRTMIKEVNKSAIKTGERAASIVKRKTQIVAGYR